MMKNKRKLLYVTSVSPFFSAGLGNDNIRLYQSLGFEVDILTKYKVDNSHTNVIYAYEDIKEKKTGIISKLIQKVINHRFYLRLFKPYLYRRIRDGVMFAVENEMYPEVPIHDYIDKIKNEYDIVVFGYLQYMFSMKSVETIAQKLKVPIFLSTIDMYLATGGCYYFGDCDGYISGCKQCKYVSKKNQIVVKKNALYKKGILNMQNVSIIGNTWTSMVLNKSFVAREKKVYSGCILINENIFRDLGFEYARQRFMVENDKFVILAGCSNDSKRKGIKYLIESINIFYDQISKCKKKNIMLLLIGDVRQDYLKQIKMNVCLAGRLTINDLVLAYSSANVYVSPSIDDAGPSMVNQSLMCGTPVVSFDIGTALDVIIDGKTGYVSPLKNSLGIAQGINNIFQLSSDEYRQMRHNCRNVSISKCSFNARFNFMSKLLLTHE